MRDPSGWLGAVRSRASAWLGAAVLCACGSDSGAVSGSGGADGGPEGGGPVPWCAAYAVLSCVCQQCHQDPPVNGAPMPLVSYADTQIEYVPGAPAYRFIENDVASGYMPFLGENSSVSPPVEPLTDAEKATLLDWIAQGALPTGGLDCGMPCDWTRGPPDGG